MTTRALMGVFAAGAILIAAACGSSTPEQSQPQSQPAAADASHSGHSGGRVFFVRPKNGDTIKPMSRFEFGSEQITIAAVPQGEVKDTRPGMAHYHLGIDTDCLPDGQVIPKGNANWIHFGSGSNFIDQQLLPGAHKLVLQAGDDLHRTMPGLCETINVTVAE